jgi:hypothetical protein
MPSSWRTSANFFRIGEGAVHHHHPQRRQPSLGEEQPRKMATGIKPHHATCHQSLRDRRQLRLVVNRL